MSVQDTRESKGSLGVPLAYHWDHVEGADRRAFGAVEVCDGPAAGEGLLFHFERAHLLLKCQAHHGAQPIGTHLGQQSSTQARGNLSIPEMCHSPAAREGLLFHFERAHLLLECQAHHGAQPIGTDLGQQSSTQAIGNLNSSIFQLLNCITAQRPGRVFCSTWKVRICCWNARRTTERSPSAPTWSSRAAHRQEGISQILKCVTAQRPGRVFCSTSNVRICC